MGRRSRLLALLARRRARELADEEDGAREPLPDEKEERAVGAQYGNGSLTHGDHGCGGRLGAFLVDVHPGLLFHLGDQQVVDRRESCEIRPVVECVDHAQGCQIVIQRPFVGHPKARQEELHFGCAEAVGNLLPLH